MLHFQFNINSPMDGTSVTHWGPWKSFLNRCCEIRRELEGPARWLGHLSFEAINQSAVWLRELKPRLIMWKLFRMRAKDGVLCFLEKSTKQQGMLDSLSHRVMKSFVVCGFVCLFVERITA